MLYQCSLVCSPLPQHIRHSTKGGMYEPSVKLFSLVEAPVLEALDVGGHHSEVVLHQLQSMSGRFVVSLCLQRMELIRPRPILSKPIHCMTCNSLQDTSFSFHHSFITRILINLERKELVISVRVPSIMLTVLEKSVYNHRAT